MIEALYIDIPFCKSSCSYCSFASMPCNNEATLDAYVLVLNKQIRRASKAGLLGNIKTIYIGGGTPTHLGLARLNEIASMLNFCLHMGNVEEFSIECNPESLTLSMVRDLFSQGVTRFSVGAQSFDNALLKSFNRVHNVSDIYTCINYIKERTNNFSLDLICGAQGQTLLSWDKTLKAALSLQPAHISIYPLSIEEASTLYEQEKAGCYTPASPDLMATFMEHAQGLISSRGLRRYEVASYALQNHECKHNISYWTGVHYLGLGAAASSLLSADELSTCISAGVFKAEVDPKDKDNSTIFNGEHHSSNTKDLSSANNQRTANDNKAFSSNDACVSSSGESAGRVRLYQADRADPSYFIENDGIQLVNVEQYDTREALLEDVMLSFRMTYGLPDELFQKARAIEPKLEAALKKLQHQGLITEKQGLNQKHFAPTQKGWLLGNEVFGAIYELI